MTDLTRVFTVTSIKSLHRKRANTIIFHFKDGTIAFEKLKGGGEKLREFRVDQCHVESHGDRQLTFIFPSVDYRKTVQFDAPDERTACTNIMNAIVESGGRAYRAFTEITESHSMPTFTARSALFPLTHAHDDDKKYVDSLKALINKKLDQLEKENKLVTFETFLLLFVQVTRPPTSTSPTTTTTSPTSPHLHQQQQQTPRNISSRNVPNGLTKGITIMNGGISPRPSPQFQHRLSSFTPSFTRPSTWFRNPSIIQGMQHIPPQHDSEYIKKHVIPPTLIDGEVVILTHQHVVLLDRKLTSRGCIYVTNYRFLFQDYWSSNFLEVTLGNVERVVKEEAIIIWCKDFRILRFHIDATPSWIDGLVKHIQNLAFPGDVTKTFAFSHKQIVPTEHDGWNLYDPLRELERIGFTKEDSGFRITYANMCYELSHTYPRLIVTPKSITDDELRIIAKYRSMARIPAVVYKHPRTGATLSRCSQPVAGIRGKRCPEDEKLIQAILDTNTSNSKAIYLMDARPYKAAVGNTVMGKGYENTNHYRNSVLQFLGIDNIHVIRSSLHKLIELTHPTESHPDESTSYLTRLSQTQWLYYIGLLLASAVKICKIMGEEGASVVLHCSDGWDRTSQISSLVLILTDPYYRTKRGFAILIEQDWLSFGHQFQRRTGHADANYQDDQRAPIFMQWLDCMYQLIRQFPLSFEFTEEYLLYLADHLYSCRFGTFLYDNENQRTQKSLNKRTVSVWTHLVHPANHHLYGNPHYRPSKKKLIPVTSTKRIVVWERLWLRYDKSARVREILAEGEMKLFARYLALRARLEREGMDLNEWDPELPAPIENQIAHVLASSTGTLSARVAQNKPRKPPPTDSRPGQGRSRLGADISMTAAWDREDSSIAPYEGLDEDMDFKTQDDMIVTRGRQRSNTDGMIDWGITPVMIHHDPMVSKPRNQNGNGPTSGNHSRTPSTTSIESDTTPRTQQTLLVVPTPRTPRSPRTPSPGPPSQSSPAPPSTMTRATSDPISNPTSTSNATSTSTSTSSTSTSTSTSTSSSTTAAPPIPTSTPTIPKITSSSMALATYISHQLHLARDTSTSLPIQDHSSIDKPASSNSTVPVTRASVPPSSSSSASSSSSSTVASPRPASPGSPRVQELRRRFDTAPANAIPPLTRDFTQ